MPELMKAGEWKIADNAKRCQNCDSPFLPGQDFFSELRWSDVPGKPDKPDKSGKSGASFALVRLDYCLVCWAAATRVADHELIYWKSQRKQGKGDQNVVDLVALHSLFMNLLGDKRPEVEVLRYVVALMLLRKKLLKVVRGAGAARGDLIFKDPSDQSGQRTMRLSTPELSEKTLGRLKKQLSEILS